MTLDTIKQHIEEMRRVKIINEDGTSKQIGELAKDNPDVTDNAVEVLVATALAMNQRWEEMAKPRYQQFKKNYPKDSRVARAIYRQANCFRSLKQKKEARLFYQELIDRFPKSSLVSKAKREMKKLK